MAENNSNYDYNQTADDTSVELYQENYNQNLLKSASEKNVIYESSDAILVENWEDLQYYSSLKDKDYVLKLKENTNYYPNDPADSSNQILFNNNVTIVGASGAYIGDISPNARNINYTAMMVPDNNGVGITVKNVLFKWISSSYQPDGTFLQMGGNSINNFENCYFTDISTNMGHSSILHIKTGDAIVTNCTFINCTTDFGCLSVYNPNDDSTGTCTRARMNVTDSYFEGNYARTEPGCINNCGVLIVKNSTFCKNSAFWWAGAIHTHGGANTTIYDSDFIDNLAGWNGGALYTYSYLQIYNSRFIGNNCTTNNGGGAIGACKYLHASYVHIEDSLFENNANLCWGLDELSTGGTGRGGAISFMDEGSLEVYNTTFIKNSASIGTAICAIAGGLSGGSPDVKIVGNRFINHTRVGDVLDVRVSTGSIAEVRDNYFENNSIVFTKLKLAADDPDSLGRVNLHVDATLKNPSSYDADILNKSRYDVYVDGVYRTTVNGSTFTLDLGRGNTARIYVVPSISNSKSNEVLAGKVKTYVYVDGNGDDSNDGLARVQPVKTLKKAIEIANSSGIENIVMMNGAFKEKDLTIDFNLTITAENNASISSVSGNIFKITKGDVEFQNIAFRNCKQESSTKERIIEQTNTGFLIMDGCIFENNQYTYLIDAAGQFEAENLQFTENNAILIGADSIVIKSSNFTENIAKINARTDTLLKYKSKTVKFEAENIIFKNNDVLKGCIYLKGPATITDSNFINNYMSATSSQRSSAIYIESGSVIVESCIFINNTDKGNYASVIYNGGKLLIKDSIIINNSYENSKGIFNGVTSGLKAITANNNWWGNTVENLTKPNLYVTEPSTIFSGWDPAEYWLVLNATSLSDEIEINKKIPVQFIFTQIDNEGNVTNYDGLKLPDFDLTLTAVNGTCSDSRITVKNGMATTYFTLTQASTSCLVGTFNGINTTISFKFKKSIPEMNISTNDILVGNAANIQVNLESGSSGSVILKIGDIIKTETIKDSKATFSILNLPAGNYKIEANYTGNDRFESAIKTGNLTVNKHDSTLVLSHGTIELNQDVLFTITLSDGATGTVDVYVNGKKETIDVGQTYSIPNIKRGDYVVRAVYGGDSYYLPSEDEFAFDVGKLIPTLTVASKDIIYGEDTIVNVNLNSDATGKVTVTIDEKTNTSELNNGKATVTISNINAGTNKVIKVDYSGDNNYKNATSSKTYNVGKATLNFTVNAENIKLGQNAIVVVQLPPRSGGTLTVSGIRLETKNIPLTGLVTFTYSDLAVGTYTVSVRYDGDNYQTISKSTTFNVLSWNVPQWPNQGYDVKNTGISPYSSETNGNVKWVKDIGGTVIGNMAIDSEGRIYVVAADGIYSINPDDGSTNWIFNSQNAGNAFSGIAIGRDTVIAPKSEDKLYFINQTTGEEYHNNIYQGSSVFAPVVDENANIYISGEYYGFEPTKLVVVPYKIWKTSVAPFSIEIGDYSITSSPVRADNNIIIITTAKKLMGIDISSKSIILNIPVAADSSPVVGLGNIVYIISDGHIKGYDIQGTNTHDIKIIGTAGNYLSAGVNGEIFSINKEGKLFEYSTGDEILIYDFKEPISSRLLVGQDEILYVGSDSGMFYAIDVEGNLLWKINLNQSISAAPVMDSNGVIYAISGNRIVAIDNNQLKNSKLTADIRNVLYGEDVTVNVDLDKDAAGKVSVKIGNLYFNESVVSNGKASFKVSDLIAGTYTAEIAYSGDSRFSSKKITTNFTVSKIKPSMEVIVNNINVGEDLIIQIKLPSDVTDEFVFISINDNEIPVKVNGGNAVYRISGLSKGTYNYTVSYNGDDNYESDEYKNIVEVGKKGIDYNVTIKDVSYGESVILNVSNLPEDASGNVTVIVNKKQYSSKLSGSDASIKISALDAGKYDAEVRFSDVKYMANSKHVSFNVKKVNPRISIVADDIKIGDDLKIRIDLAKNATGNVTVKVGKFSKTATLIDGVADMDISGLTSEANLINVSYSGDKNYYPASESKKITVSKINTSIIILAEDIKCGENLIVKVNLNKEATGNVTVSVGDISQTVKLVNGSATASLSSLSYGDKVIDVKYHGDEKFNSISASKNITVNDRIELITVPIDIKVVNNSHAEVSMGNVTGNVAIILDGEEKIIYLNNGKARIDLNNLPEGDHTITVVYDGDNVYAPSHAVSSFNVPESVFPISSEFKEITVNDDLTISFILKDENGNVIVNAPITYTINGVTGNKATDSKGSFVIPCKEGAISVNYGGNDTFSGTDMKLTFKEPDVPVILNIVSSRFNIPNGVITINGFAVDTKAGEEGIYYSTELLDGYGKPIKGVAINFAVNNKIYNRITNDKGGFEPYKLNMIRAGRYTMAFYFAGTDDYLPAFAAVCVDLDKKPINIKASAKSFKASAVKKYTIALSTIMGSSHDGKVHLSPKEVTLSVNGKTYVAKTNSNGKATFNLKITKKGNYNAEISFKGDATYDSATKSVKLTIT